MAFSGYQDFNENFSTAIQAMIAARPGISINSGYRSPERQAELYAAAIRKYGSPEAARHWVAPPGKSQHNHGLAADLAFASPEDRAWAHANAANFGLNFRMGHEPWHVELSGEHPETAEQAQREGVTIPLSGRGLTSTSESPTLTLTSSSQSAEPTFKPRASVPVEMSALKPVDILTLSNLISRKESLKASPMDNILKAIGNYG